LRRHHQLNISLLRAVAVAAPAAVVQVDSALQQDLALLPEQVIRLRLVAAARVRRFQQAAQTDQKVVIPYSAALPQPVAVLAQMSEIPGRPLAGLAVLVAAAVDGRPALQQEAQEIPRQLPHPKATTAAAMVVSLEIRTQRVAVAARAQVEQTHQTELLVEMGEMELHQALADRLLLTPVVEVGAVISLEP